MLPPRLRDHRPSHAWHRWTHCTTSPEISVPGGTLDHVYSIRSALNTRTRLASGSRCADRQDGTERTSVITRGLGEAARARGVDIATPHQVRRSRTATGYST